MLVLAFGAAVSLAPSRTSPAASRRAVLGAGSAALSLVALAGPFPSAALIKGSTPAQLSKPKRATCTNIDECRASGERTRDAMASGADETFERTAGGDRYRDIVKGSGRAVADGDAVNLRYRVMRLGTRSRDGLSGEGQVIFSLGFGEDDDQEGETLAVELRPGVLVRRRGHFHFTYDDAHHVWSLLTLVFARVRSTASTRRWSGCSPAAGGVCLCGRSEGGRTRPPPAPTSSSRLTSGRPWRTRLPA
jgi:hypothetical protein